MLPVASFGLVRSLLSASPWASGVGLVCVRPQSKLLIIRLVNKHVRVRPPARPLPWVLE